jgi:DNA-binding YbaB/EbfC family protein
MNDILKQAQNMQSQMQKTQDDLVNIKVEGSSGGGMVKATANGKLEILTITIDPEVINGDDKEMLEDLIAAAVNQTIKNAQAKANEEMKKITGGLNLPGNFKIPGL